MQRFSIVDVEYWNLDSLTFKWMIEWSIEWLMSNKWSNDGSNEWSINLLLQHQSIDVMMTKCSKKVLRLARFDCWCWMLSPQQLNCIKWMIEWWIKWSIDCVLREWWRNALRKCFDSRASLFRAIFDVWVLGCDWLNSGLMIEGRVRAGAKTGHFKIDSVPL